MAIIDIRSGEITDGKPPPKQTPVPGSDQTNYLKYRSNDEFIAAILTLEYYFWRANSPFQKEVTCQEQTGITFPDVFGTSPIGAARKNSC